MTLLRDLICVYLIVTLAATGLAKLRRWRSASVALVRDSVLPRKLVPSIVVGISLAELGLSSALAIGIEVRLAALATATMFVVFGVYRVIAANNSKQLTCGCAGAVRSDPVTPRALAATLLASALQALAAVVLVVPGASLPRLAGLAALALPFCAFLLGELRRRLGVAASSVQNQPPAAELVAHKAAVDMSDGWPVSQ